MGFLATFSGGGSPAYKEPVRTATSSPISLSSAPASISSVTLNLNDRILVKDQADATQNGIYLFKGAGNPLVRAADANTSRELVPGLVVSVTEGDNGERTYQLITDAPIVLGTTDLDFALAVDLEADVEGILPVENGGTGTASWSEGRIVFAGTNGETLTQDTSLHWDDTNKRLGVGTTTPNAKVQINNSGAQAGLSVYSTSTNNSAIFFNQGTTNYTLELNSAANSAFTGASIGGYFARGTLSTRAQTLANDSLLSITASGHTGTSAAGISAGIILAADQNTGASAFGGQIVFATTPNSTVALLPTARMVVKNDGKVGIGTLTPAQLLDVSGTAKANLFYANAGSVSAPAYSFTSDTNTGIYSATADTLNLTTQGRNRLEISPAGYITVERVRTASITENPGINFSAVSSINSTDQALFNFQRARGTAISKAQIESGDFLGNISFEGYVTSGSYAIGAQIYANATSPWNEETSSYPTQLVFLIANKTIRIDENANLVIPQELRLTNSLGSGRVSLKASTAPVAYSLTFPGSLSAGALVTDGSGFLSWVTTSATSTSSTIVQRSSTGESAFKAISLDGATSGAVKLAVPATVTSHTLTFPSTQGAAGTVLKNNGSGGLSWTLPSSVRSRHALTGVVTISTTDEYIGCDPTGGTVSMTLPSATTAGQGRKLVIKSEAATGLVVITAASGESIDGSPAHILNASYESVTLVCNGTNAWFIV